jgi:hypothetical protein
LSGRSLPDLGCALPEQIQMVFKLNLAKVLALAGQPNLDSRLALLWASSSSR